MCFVKKVHLYDGKEIITLILQPENYDLPSDECDLPKYCGILYTKFYKTRIDKICKKVYNDPQ